MIQAILHAHLVPQCPHADILGLKGRVWLLRQLLPDDESAAIERHISEYDRLTDDLRVVERELARDALGSAQTKRLMTIHGIEGRRRWTTRQLVGELAARGLKTDGRAVWVFVLREGLSFKKTLVPAEQDRPGITASGAAGRRISIASIRGGWSFSTRLGARPTWRHCAVGA